MTERNQLKKIVELLDDKIAIDLKAIDVSSVNPYVKYFVIGEGKNERHLHALISHLKKEKVEDLPLNHVEGSTHSEWYLADLGNVVVHLFTKDARNEYGLEKLYGELPMFLGDEILRWPTNI